MTLVILYFCLMFRLLIVKRKMESVLIVPFILIGSFIARMFPLKQEFEIFFFFPFFHTGGAEKIHAQISVAIGSSRSIIFFTRKSHNRTFYSMFEQSGSTIIDISRFTDNKWLYFLNLIYRGIIRHYINIQSKKPIVFNGQSNFGYKISPWINKSIVQIDVLHSLNTFSYIRIPYIPFYSKTVMISQLRIQQHKDLYIRYGIPLAYLKRIQYITNAVDFEKKDPNLKPHKKLKVLYSGRESPEKRIHIFLEIANLAHAELPNVQFHIAGFEPSMSIKSSNPFVIFHGEIDNRKKLDELYWNTDILILVSETEGFPLVIIEAMAAGCAIISTPVGDIPYHVSPNNGFLFSSIENKEQILLEAINYIKELSNNPQLLKSMATENIKYALKNFTITQFNTSYRSLVTNVKAIN